MWIKTFYILAIHVDKHGIKCPIKALMCTNLISQTIRANCFKAKKLYILSADKVTKNTVTHFNPLTNFGKN